MTFEFYIVQRNVRSLSWYVDVGGTIPFHGTRTGCASQADGDVGGAGGIGECGGLGGPVRMVLQFLGQVHVASSRGLLPTKQPGEDRRAPPVIARLGSNNTHETVIQKSYTAMWFI